MLKVSPNVNVPSRKVDYAKKGAKIALGVDLATRAVAVGAGIKLLGKEEYFSALKGIVSKFGKGKTAALVAGSLALTALIGAGIGKIVEKVKAKNEAKAE